MLQADTSPEGSGLICVVSGRLTGEHGIETAACPALEAPATLGAALVRLHDRPLTVCVIHAGQRDLIVIGDGTVLVLIAP